jgi:hypothetical protein
MSRHGYSDDLDPLELGRWRGMVSSAIRGKRGQKFLREMLSALDSMEEKRLVGGVLGTEHGGVCALGAVLKGRGEDVSAFDPYDHKKLAALMDVSYCLIQEVEFVNDDTGAMSTFERWETVRAWVVKRINDDEKLDD